MMQTGKREAMRRGFMTGFSSPYQFLFGAQKRVMRQHRDLVALSWETVGNTVSHAMDTEGVEIGKYPKSSPGIGR